MVRFELIQEGASKSAHKQVVYGVPEALHRVRYGVDFNVLDSWVLEALNCFGDSGVLVCHVEHEGGVADDEDGIPEILRDMPG